MEGRKEWKKEEQKEGKGKWKKGKGRRSTKKAEKGEKRRKKTEKKKNSERSGKEEKENRKRTKSKMEKHKFSPTTSQAPGFLVCKKRTFPKKRSLISGMLILIISTGIIYPVRTKQRLEIENPAAFASDFS